MTAVFADTNVAVYPFGQDRSKAKVAREILDAAPFISTQVVSEFLNVCRVKLHLDKATRHQLARELMESCPVVAVDADIVGHAMRLESRYGFSWWDSLIVAAALGTGCGTLYSEDLQHGQVIEGRLGVVNPFL